MGELDWVLTALEQSGKNVHKMRKKSRQKCRCLLRGEGKTINVHVALT